MLSHSSANLLDYRIAFRIRELARMVGVSVEFIRLQLKSGELKGHKLGKDTVVILRADADNWLKRQPISPGSGELETEGDDVEAA